MNPHHDISPLSGGQRGVVTIPAGYDVHSLWERAAERRDATAGVRSGEEAHMQWQGRRGSANVEDRRGLSTGPVAVGGGILGAIIALVLGLGLA